MKNLRINQVTEDGYLDLVVIPMTDDQIDFIVSNKHVLSLTKTQAEYVAAYLVDWAQS